MKINFVLELSDSQEATIRQLTARFADPTKGPSRFVEEALEFALRRVQSGMPLDGSLLQSLEENHCNGKATIMRGRQIAMHLEMAIADSMAVRRAVEPMLKGTWEHDASLAKKTENG